MKKTLITGFVLIFSFISLMPVSAQESDVKEDPNRFGIIFNAGFGWANNLRTEDALNAYRDIARLAFNPGYQEKNEKTTLIYGGFDLEPRFFTNNIVYGLAIGYHRTMTGERNIEGTALATSNPLTYHVEASISMFSILGTVYYKVIQSDSSFLLLGGGLGYYRAALELKTGFNNDINSYKGNSWTIGWHTQLEYNKTLGNFVLMGGVMSRFAEVWKLEINDNSGNEKYDSSVCLTGIYFYIGAGYLI